MKVKLTDPDKCGPSKVTVLTFLFSLYLQQCDLIRFVRDHSREYLCVREREHLGRVRAFRTEAVWARRTSRLNSLAEKADTPAAGCEGLPREQRTSTVGEKGA